MRGVFIALGLTLVLSIVIAGIANGQMPYIGVYFDRGYSQETEDCQGIGVFDTLYVAAFNFNRFLSGADFMIEYPPAITPIWDMPVWTVWIGQTWVGYSVGFPLPQNGFSPVPLVNVVFSWNCAKCSPLFNSSRIKVVQNPATNFLGAVDYPGFNLVWAVGLTMYICPTSIPVEQTTWGQVKALYGE